MKNLSCHLLSSPVPDPQVIHRGYLRSARSDKIILSSFLPVIQLTALATSPHHSASMHQEPLDVDLHGKAHVLSPHSSPLWFASFATSTYLSSCHRLLSINGKTGLASTYSLTTLGAHLAIQFSQSCLRSTCQFCLFCLHPMNPSFVLPLIPVFKSIN